MGLSLGGALCADMDVVEKRTLTGLRTSNDQYYLEQLYQMAEDGNAFLAEDKMIKNIVDCLGDQLELIVEYINGSENDDTKLQDAIDMLVSLYSDMHPELTEKDCLRAVLQAR